MKRQYIFLIFGIITALILGFIPNTALAQDKVQVIVNNQLVAFPDQQPFINKDNRTLVPVRAPMELAGAKVDWEDISRTVVVSKDGIAAVFVIGSKQYKVNGESQTMDTQAQIVNDRTCFPIRFVAEALGMQVVWDANSRTVKITNTVTSTTFIKPTIDLQAEEPKQTAESSQKPMTTLTPEAKARLMAYPYPVQYEIERPMVEFNKGNCAYAPTVYEWISEAFSDLGILGQNHRFVTDGDLCYKYNKPLKRYRIRGVLQTTQQDGSIIGQDVEYGLGWGTNFVQPGQPTRPSHWLDDYDTVYLSAPVRVK